MSPQTAQEFRLMESEASLFWIYLAPRGASPWKRCRAMGYFLSLASDTRSSAQGREAGWMPANSQQGSHAWPCSPASSAVLEQPLCLLSPVPSGTASALSCLWLQQGWSTARSRQAVLFSEGGPKTKNPSSPGMPAASSQCTRHNGWSKILQQHGMGGVKFCNNSAMSTG